MQHSLAIVAGGSHSSFISELGEAPTSLVNRETEVHTDVPIVHARAVNPSLSVLIAYVHFCLPHTSQPGKTLVEPSEFPRKLFAHLEETESLGCVQRSEACEANPA